jgi:MATE family multidrug resistance protein
VTTFFNSFQQPSNGIHAHSIQSFVNAWQLGMASALETLCGQAYGAKQYSMIGIYLQRSWIILLLTALLLVPLFVFTEPLLVALGQPADVARLAGELSMCMLPMHFQFAIILPLNKFF